MLTHSFALEPAATLTSWRRPARGSTRPAEPDWAGAWRSADERAAQAIEGVLGGGGLSEPAVAAELGALLPAQATLFVASSMPVRDIETFWPVAAGPAARALQPRRQRHRRRSSRAPSAPPPRATAPVVLLIGDVALAHDLGGLLAARRLGLKLTIVLLDNGGGGIFDFLEVARSPLARGGDFYERHVATPTGLDFAAAAGLYGLAHERAEDAAGFRAALERALGAPASSIIEVRGERRANVELHARVWEAVAAAVSGT